MIREPAFLVGVVRRFLHHDSTLPDSANLDWIKLLHLASAHAVTPMLYAVLREASLAVPAPIATDLRSSFDSCVRQSLAQSAELSRLAGLFEANGITAIAVKGPMLGKYLYGRLAARSSGDIDLLAKRSDILRIRDLLLSGGYLVSNTFHWQCDSAYLRNRENEISFLTPSGVSIDVHWRVLPGYFASPFDSVDVWKALQTAPLAGRSVQTLAPEHVFYLLCAHSAKHGFERLGWICDIARFLMVTPDLDWQRVVDQARRTHTLRQILLSVRLAADVLGAETPANLPKDASVDRLVGFVKHRLLTGVVPPTSAAHLTRFSFQLLETARHRVRFLAGHVTPSEAEYAALKLPPSLHFLYYAFRPARLLVKYIADCRGGL